MAPLKSGHKTINTLLDNVLALIRDLTIEADADLTVSLDDKHAFDFTAKNQVGVITFPTPFVAAQMVLHHLDPAAVMPVLSQVQSIMLASGWSIKIMVGNAHWVTLGKGNDDKWTSQLLARFSALDFKR